jgi:YbbR domain-containing protein
MTANNLTEKIFENWPAKIVCIALALLLFLFYRMSTLQERYFSVPLLVETNGDLVPASAYPKMVKITLRGESDSIYPIQEEDVIAYLDISHFTKEGEYRVPVQTKLKGTALDVDPLEVAVEPVELNLRLEHRLVKKLQVTPSFKGYPEAGYEFAGYTVKPANVEVSGPRSIVEKMGDIVTETVELSGRNASFEGVTALVHRSQLVSINGDGKISFAVTINQTTLVKNFEDVPFYFENLDPGLTAETDKVSGTIQIKGTQTDLSEWTIPENALTVLCENISAPGVYTLPVRAIIPQPYEVLQSSPGEVQVTVRRKAE